MAWLVAMLAVAAPAFVYGRYAADDQIATADLPTTVEQEALPGPEDTPVAGSTPDTSKPLWGIPYLNEDAAKPRFDQEFNGIKVGPTVKVASSGLCKQGEAMYVDPQSAEGSPLAIADTALPSGATLDQARVIRCNSTVVAVEHDYIIPAADGAESKIRNGEASWFDVQHGGAISVFRGFKEYPAQDSSIAADRWFAGTVAGHPAAIARPVLDGGFGRSLVVVWEADQGIETVISGTEVRLDDLLRIAEEVAK